MNYYQHVYTVLVQEKNEAFDLWGREVRSAQALMKIDHWNPARCALSRATEAENHYKILSNALNRACKLAEDRELPF